ncbi:MAG: glutamine--fructose-6-phosphate transaminase (isomerizing) [Alphaproteobacteria bacterium]|nr:MAG: glutamine--fructose-6-phosphate transaminase (isomerizing) [Alphaproteobacteria bacterium]
MCGIFGTINGSDAAPVLLDGLGRLDYRGYDSAGLAVLDKTIAVRKLGGSVDALASLIRVRPAEGRVGIAHTRWATHGAATSENAHPHVFDGIAVVHNGVIENHDAIRTRLQQDGHEFQTSTDSEVLPHLISHHRRRGQSAVVAVQSALGEVHGSYAVAVLMEDIPDLLIAGRRGSPLVVGHDEDGGYIASDPAALAGYCAQYAALGEGALALVARGAVLVMDQTGAAETPRWQQVPSLTTVRRTGAGAHMAAELAEIPAAVAATLAAADRRVGRTGLEAGGTVLLTACGSSRHAAAIGAHWLEHWAGVPTRVEIASELLHRPTLLAEAAHLVALSQSGETADTLAVVRMAAAASVPTAAIVNVAHSQMAREAGTVWPTLAGAEQAVAATKSFASQLAVLARLSLDVAEARGTLSPVEAVFRRRALERLPSWLGQVLDGVDHDALSEAVKVLARARTALAIGRDIGAEIAAEAALKLAELAYLPTLAVPAGELKHGPIALLEPGVPVIAILIHGPTLAKQVVSLEEVAARGAGLILIGDDAALTATHGIAALRLPLPPVADAVAWAALPLGVGVIVQRLAMMTALARGLNPDRPRNLAKSVTVE